MQRMEGGQRGRTSSVGTKARVVRTLELELQPDSPCKVAKMSYNQTVKHIAVLEHIAPKQIRQWHAAAAKDGSLENRPVERITRADQQHAQYMEYGPSLAVQKFIYAWEKSAKVKGTYTSVPQLQAELNQECDTMVHHETLRLWLHKLGIHYGKQKLSPLPIAYTNCLIRRYIVEYVQLLRLEEAGKIVLVWMDESYIHAGYRSGKGWYRDEEGAVVKGRVCATEKGKRIIIIHAMTRYGMLEVPLDDEDISDNLGDARPSASVVSTQLSEEGGDKEDYHDTMDGPKFVAWIRNRLLVAFEKMFPGKKMCLILDNAKYHKARGEDWISPTGMLKSDMAEQLLAWDIMEIKDGEKVWPAGSYHLSAKGGEAPTAELLRDVMKCWLMSHAKNSTLVEQALAVNNHQLLYTPQYESWLQPIEMVWATVKKQVAMQARADRKYEETQQQTRAALSKLTAAECAKTIRHVEKDMDRWLKTADARHLQRWGSLASMKAASHEELANHADMGLENFREDQEDEADKENQAEAAKKKQKRQVEVRVRELGARKGTRVRRQVCLAPYTFMI